jgi:hypothetical protein
MTSDQVHKAKERIRARWKRGLVFRRDWTTLEFYLLYSDTVDAEGIA